MLRIGASNGPEGSAGASLGWVAAGGAEEVVTEELKQMRVIRIKHSSPGFVNTLDEKLREGVTLVVTQAAKQRVGLSDLRPADGWAVWRGRIRPFPPDCLHAPCR